MSFMPVPPSIELLRGQETVNATAQTGGFAQANDASSVGVEGFGGGLGSSPNVPKPGTSINPATGKPHTAGLTRAELEQKRAQAAAIERANGGITSTTADIPAESTAGLTKEEVEHIKNKGAELLDVSPQTEVVRRGSTSAGESKLSQEGRAEIEALSGREQAARQLTATAPGARDNSHLAVGGPAEAGAVTPGLELPGAWGPVKATGLPGSGPNAPTSIYEDLSEGLNKVGQVAFAAIPSPIKEAFHQQSAQPIKDAIAPKSATSPRVKPADTPTSPKLGVNIPDSSPLGAGAGGRRGSAAAIFEQAKQRANMVVHDVQETLQQTGRRASMTVNESPLLAQVKSLAKEAFATPVVGQQNHVTIGPIAMSGRGVPVVAITPRTSLPSDEPAGALPGEHSSGAGALPGSANEAGVAILPDEKKPAQTLPSQENQGVLPGETSEGVGALPGKLGETGVAVLPDERATSAYDQLKPAGRSVAGPSGTSGLSAAPSSAAPSTGLNYDAAPSAPESTVPSFERTSPTPVDDNTQIPPPPLFEASATAAAVAPTVPEPSTSAIHDTTPAPSVPASYGAYTGLAAPLPSTFLGLGADKGATDVETVLTGRSTPGDSVASSSFIGDANVDAPTSVADANTTSADTSLAPSTSPPTHHGIDRATSSASVTAIRAGHEGTIGSSKLAQSTLPPTEEVIVPVGASEAGVSSQSSSGQQSTTRGTGPNHTTSLSPGSEVDGVGHPSSRDTAGATREPGTYPTPDHSKATEFVAAPANHIAAQDTPAPVNNKLNGEESPATPASSSTPSKSSAAAVSTSAATPTHNGTSKTSAASPTGQSSGHERTASGSSNSKRKSGFFGKIKDKLKHKD